MTVPPMGVKHLLEERSPLAVHGCAEFPRSCASQGCSPRSPGLGCSGEIPGGWARRPALQGPPSVHAGRV